jgi:hypothetical protein
MGVPGEGDENVEVGFLGISLRCHVNDELFKCEVLRVPR